MLTRECGVSCARRRASLQLRRKLTSAGYSGEFQTHRSCRSVWTGPMGSTSSEALDRLAGGSWMLFLVLSPLVSWAILFYALYTSYYWLALLYLAWMWLDRHTPYRGGRRMEWTRKLRLWRRAASYFPLRLVKTAELPPDRNYILAVYPHGVLSYGGFLGFCTDAVAVSEALPGVTARPFTLNVNFYMPFVRDFLMALGFCSVSAESLGFFLEDRKAGNALGLVAGGAAEALLSEPGAYRLMANRRKGIVRLAIKHGAHLVPVLSLGEPELYDQVRSPWLQRIQQKIKDLTGVCPVVPIGWGLLQDRFGILPRRRPITVLVGKPIEVEAVEEPTSQQVDQLHVEFIRQLVELFESHKHKYVDDADNVHLTFV